jgi:hypothetical protein
LEILGNGLTDPYELAPQPSETVAEVRNAVAAAVSQGSLPRLLLFLALLMVAFSVTPRSAAADVMAECYGERVDIVLPEFDLEDGTSATELRLSLPSPDAWLIVLPGNTMLDAAPCQTEPVVASRATIMGIDAKLGHSAILSSSNLGVNVQMIRIGRARSGNTLRSSAARRQELVISEGKDVGGDFWRRQGTNTDEVGGTWLFPEDYPSGFGNRINMGCAGGICRISYGLDLDRNIHLSYRLSVEDPSQRPNWIAIDQAVRALVLGWIEES